MVVLGGSGWHFGQRMGNGGLWDVGLGGCDAQTHGGCMASHEGQAAIITEEGSAFDGITNLYNDKATIGEVYRRFSTLSTLLQSRPLPPVPPAFSVGVSE